MNDKFKTYEANAVNLFRTSSAAILSTVSKKHDGYPFGSFITYVSSRNRNIFLYASDIAEHTKNLKNNGPRVKPMLTEYCKIHVISLIFRITYEFPGRSA